MSSPPLRAWLHFESATVCKMIAFEDFESANRNNQANMDFDDDLLEDGKKYFWLNWRFFCLSKRTKFFHVSNRLRILRVIVLCLLYWITNSYSHNSIVQTLFKCLFYISVFLSAPTRKNWIISGLRYTLRRNFVAKCLRILVRLNEQFSWSFKVVPKGFFIISHQWTISAVICGRKLSLKI